MKKEVVDRIEDIRSAAVGTGFMGVMVCQSDLDLQNSIVDFLV